MMPDFYYDPARKLLVYEADAARVQHFIPEARQVNGKLVALPATLQSVQLMRWLGREVPNIMELDGYDWPIEAGRTALPHQKMMAAFFASHPRSLNLSDMGTMKTLPALWAADYVMSKYPKGEFRALVVAPLSILDRVWAATLFANFLGRRTCEIVHGSAAKREGIIRESKADFLIINFDGVGVGARTRRKFELDGVSKLLRERDDLRLVIVDEASAYRDSRTKRHRIAREIFNLRHYLWMLTGTPTPNGPTDAYGLAKLVNGAKNESFRSFHARTMFQVSQFKWLPRQGAEKEVRKLLSPAVRVDIRDVWQGPELTYQDREVDLTDAQNKAMRELKRDLQVEVKSGPITAVNEAAARSKFLQISLGAIYDGEHKAHRIDAAPRLSELDAVIAEAKRKIIVFVPLTSIVHLVYGHLIKQGVGCAIVNGQVSAADRSALISQFGSDDSLRCLVVDPATTAHGINEFVAADVAVWYGATDKTELYLQGNKRLHRPGQQYPVTIVNLMSNKVEREIYRRLEHNESMQGLLLDMVRTGAW